MVLSIHIKKTLSLVFITGLVVLFVMTLYYNQKMYLPDKRNSDFFYSEENRASNEIIIVTIDDKSLRKDELGRWFDWERSYYADIIDYLSEAEARVIGVDVLFSDESKNTLNDRRLLEVSEKYNNVVLAAKKNLQKPGSIYSDNNWGYVDIPLDGDGTARQLEIPYEVGSELFSIKIFQKYLGINDVSYMKNGEYIITEKNIRLPWDPTKKVLATKVPIVQDDRILINYFAEPRTYKRYSFTDVYHKRIDKAEFKNKIVLIGEDGAGLFDEHFTPMDHNNAMPGVEIHASMIDTLLSGEFLNYQSDISFVIASLLLTGISIFLFYISSIPIGVFVLIGVFIVFISIATTFFYSGLVIHSMYYGLEIVFAYAATLMFRYFTESNEKNYIQKAFSQYVNPDLLKELMQSQENLTLGGTKKTLTVFFSDIAGFTSLSEKCEADKLVALLNEYLTEMTDIIFQKNGTVDKYIGDAIMAFWGAPVPLKEHALKACMAAIENQKKLKELRKEWKKSNVSELHIRIGIHTGEMIVGNIGSKTRFNYTVIGDAVNLASRLEGVNKQYGTKMIISEETYKYVNEILVVRQLDKICVKGKALPIKIYELIGTKEEVSQESLEMYKLYENALDLYYNQSFEEAKTLLEKILSQYKDPPTTVLLQRIENFIKNPPSKSWDGAYEMTVK